MIRYTPRARDDLVSIFHFISNRHAAAAKAVRAQIVFSIGLLAEFPELGVERPELGVRALGVPRYAYTVYYRVEGEDVWVVHIRDDRRSPLTSWEV